MHERAWLVALAVTAVLGSFSHDVQSQPAKPTEPPLWQFAAGG